MNIVYRKEEKRRSLLSGAASDRRTVSNLIKNINRIITEYKVSEVLDIPCGDFCWIQGVNLKEIKYTGMDVCGYIIDKNRESHSSKMRSFLCGDIVSDPLPKNDLVICKDSFEVMSDEDIMLSIANIKKSGSKFLLITNKPFCLFNDPCCNFSFSNIRDINILKSPFSLPSPIESFCYADNSGTWVDYCYMNLYRLAEVN